METLILMATLTLTVYTMVGFILFFKILSGAFDVKSVESTINLDKIKAEDNYYTKAAAQEHAQAAEASRKAAEANLKAEEVRLERVRLELQS